MTEPVRDFHILGTVGYPTYSHDSGDIQLVGVEMPQLLQGAPVILAQFVPFLQSTLIWVLMRAHKRFGKPVGEDDNASRIPKVE